MAVVETLREEMFYSSLEVFGCAGRPQYGSVGTP